MTLLLISCTETFIRFSCCVDIPNFVVVVVVVVVVAAVAVSALVFIS